MALLFDEAQGAFKDTGSQTSPMKKSTGLMRKQMSKMDEVAPRGHTLAYITPEEAQILNKGGGGIDAQGNQMTGPYGVPMYQGFVDRQRKSRMANAKTQQSKPQTQASPHTDKSSFVSRPESKPTSTPSPHVGRPSQPEKSSSRPTEMFEAAAVPKKKEKLQQEIKQETQKLPEKKEKELSKDREEEISSGDYLKDWWKNREREKEQLLPVEKPTIKIAEFNLDKFNQKLGSIIGGVWGGGFTVNPNILGNLSLPSGNAINDILTDKEKGVGILNWKGGVSKEIIEFIQENAPENEAQKQQMINMLNRLPQNVQDNIKKAVSEGEISLDVVAVKPFGVDGVIKLASGDLILDAIPDVLNELPNIENNIRQMEQYQKLQKEQYQKLQKEQYKKLQMEQYQKLQQKLQKEKKSQERMRDIEEKYLKPLGKMYRQTPTGEWEIVPFLEAKANQSLMNNDLPEEFQVASTGSLRGLL